jgi:hypothetical protein
MPVCSPKASTAAAGLLNSRVYARFSLLGIPKSPGPVHFCSFITAIVASLVDSSHDLFHAYAASLALGDERERMSIRFTVLHASLTTY